MLSIWMNEKTSGLFSGGGRTQEERLQEGEQVDDGAEICQTDDDACGGGAAGQKAGRQGADFDTGRSAES